MIETNNLTKKFTSFKKEEGFKGSVKSFFNRDPITKYAVNDFSFKVEKGEIKGLLGPNGAGKTTLMKMLTGIIVPSSGEVSIAGYKPWQRDKEFRKKIALVMGQKSQLWWDIPAMDSFQLLQKYYEIPDIQFKKKLGHMGELLDVTELFHIHVRKLSLGERMKLELMASLLHEPEVLFLDEPTIGLDLVAQENMRNFLKEYHAKNDLSIILTSHYMADVQALCKDLVLISKGQKAYDGPLQSLEKILGDKKSVYFSFDKAIDPNDDFWSKFDCDFFDANTSVELRLDKNELSEISTAILSRFPVVDFHTEKLPIEKVMKKIMENPEILTNV